MTTKQIRSQKNILLDKAKTNLYSGILIPKIVFFIAGIISLLFFVLFISTASNEHVGYAYSDELMATAYNLGLSRPPGQIFYILLLHFFLNLPIPVTIAMRGHLLSALMQSLSLGLLIVSLWLLIEKLKQIKPDYANLQSSFRFSSLAVSVLTVLLLGLTPFIWLYGSLAEVPAFINLLLSILIYISYQLMFGKTRSRAIYYLLAIFTLLVVDLPQVIFLLPFIIIVIKNSKIKFTYIQLSKYIAFFLLLFSLSIFIFIFLAKSENVLSWYVDPNLTGIWNYFTTNNFGENRIWQAFGTRILDTFPIYIQNLQQYLGWFLIVLVFLGARFAFIISKKIFWTILLLSGIGAVIYPLMLSWSSDQLTQVIILRQYAMFWILFSIPIAIALWILFIRFVKAFSVLSPRIKIMQSILLALALLICFGKFNTFNSSLRLSGLNIFTNIHKEIINSIPQNSLFVCKDDITCGSLLFDQQVLGIKKDISILPTQYPLVKKKLELQKLNGFDYEYNPYIIFDYITWNMGKKPVYMSGSTQVLHDILGMPYGFLYYLPRGYAGELTRKLPSELPAIDVGSSKAIVESVFYPEDLMFSLQKNIIAQYHIFNALIYEKMGQRDLARDQLNMGTNLLYDIPNTADETIESYRISIESMGALSSWSLESQSQSLEEVMANAQKAIDIKRLNTAYVGAVGAVNLSPTNIEARLMLAKIYELRKQYSSALLEYRNVLKIDPENEIAKEKIKTLDSK